MKSIPLILSTVVCGVTLVLSVTFFAKASGNRALKEEVIKLQDTNQTLQQQSKAQEDEAQHGAKVFQVTQGIAQLRQMELQRQQKIIETGATVAQKLGPQILSNIGYLAAKNNNQKLKEILAKQDWQDFIPSPERLKQIEEQIAKGQASGDGAPAPAPAPSPSPSTTPAPRPPR